jgi:flagellar hook-associated protein 1 FlgK
MSDLMRIGSSAMNAAYAQLQTTGHNIANASTPGYVRREVIVQEAGSMTGDGFVGRGVDAMGATRVYNQFLVRESVASKAAAAQDAARSGNLQRLDDLFADPATGVGASFDGLVSAFADVAAKPSDQSARAVVLSRAQGFADRVTALDGKLLELRQSAQNRMGSEVDRANQTLAALAQINQRLGQSQGSGGASNALLDERDRQLEKLNEVMRANATFGADGRITVTSQRGDPLVVGSDAVRLQLDPDSLDSTQRSVSIVRSDGKVTPLQASDVGGSLAGLLRFAGEDLDAARAQLGRLAAAVAGAFNDRQARGVDATGQPGQPLFAIGSPTASAALDNVGSAALVAQIQDPTALKASDYSVEFRSGQYRVTRLSDGVEQSLGALPATVDGLRLSVDGATAPQDGNRFLIRGASAVAAGLRALQSNPNRIATALPVVAETGAGNGGDLRMTGVDMPAAGASGGAAVTLTFTSPTTFQITEPAGSPPTTYPYTPGMAFSLYGGSVTLQGTPAAGDTLRFRPTPSPQADNRNALALQALGDARFVDGGTAIDRYAELVGDVGSRAQSAKSSLDMSERLQDDAERARTEVSGVNLDEEAARLMQYQQAYQAAAKVIAAANEMFRTLLEATS